MVKTVMTSATQRMKITRAHVGARSICHGAKSCMVSVGGQGKVGQSQLLLSRNVSCNAQVSSNDIKNGMSLEIDGVPFKVFIV